MNLCPTLFLDKKWGILICDLNKLMVLNAVDQTLTASPTLEQISI
jgi:hypothetical protein